MMKTTKIVLFTLFAIVTLSQLWAQTPKPAAPPAPDYILSDMPPNWTTYNGRLFSIRVGFAILYDYTFFDQNQESIDQVGEQEDQRDLRSGRILLSGALKFKKPWIYVIARDYNENREPEDQIFDGLDARLVIPLWSDTKFSIGKQKEPFVYEMVGDAAFLPMQERILSPFFVSRNIGLKLSGTTAEQKMSWSFGWFNDWFEKNVAFDESSNQFAGRITALPIISADGTEYLHLGFSARRIGSTEGTFRFKGRPESNVADNFLDTGTFNGKSAKEVGLEALYNKGGASILAEVVPGLWVDSPEKGDPRFLAITSQQAMF
jgi:phosphate-selective porin OprO and OprP